MNPTVLHNLLMEIQGELIFIIHIWRGAFIAFIVALLLQNWYLMIESRNKKTFHATYYTF